MASLPPINVTQKAVKENCFSKHDNRHAFQNSGVYFGQGLGKKPVSRGRSQHNSENHTSWDTSSQNHSTYVSDFSCSTLHASVASSALPALCRQDSSLLQKFHVFSKPTFHRFPRKHRTTNHPPPPPVSQLETWFSHDHSENKSSATSASTTPLVVLAESQKPFLTHNPWLYSYKS